MTPTLLPWDSQVWKASVPSSTATEVTQGDRLQLKLPSVAVRLASQVKAMGTTFADTFCQAT